MAKAIHSMIRVLDEARSVGSTGTPSGSRSPTVSISTASRWSTCAIAEADFEVELTINKGRTEPYDLGDGYGHIAFVVDDLDAEHARLTRPASPRASWSTSAGRAG